MKHKTLHGEGKILKENKKGRKDTKSKPQPFSLGYVFMGLRWCILSNHHHRIQFPSTSP